MIAWKETDFGGFNNIINLLGFGFTGIMAHGVPEAVNTDEAQSVFWETFLYFNMWLVCTTKASNTFDISTGLFPHCHQYKLKKLRDEITF